MPGHQIDAEIARIQRTLDERRAEQRRTGADPDRRCACKFCDGASSADDED